MRGGALWFEQVKEGLAPDLAPAQLAQLESMKEAIAPMISTFMVSGYVINLTVALLLARWWQSALFNPGGFKAEFLTLRLPEKLLAPTLLGLIALLLLRGGAPPVFQRPGGDGSASLLVSGPGDHTPARPFPARAKDRVDRAIHLAYPVSPRGFAHRRRDRHRQRLFGKEASALRIRAARIKTTANSSEEVPRWK